MAREAHRRTLGILAAVASTALAAACAPAAAVAAGRGYYDSEEAPPTTFGLWLGIIICILVVAVVPLAIRWSRARRERPPALPRAARGADARDAAADLTTPGVRGDADQLFRDIQAAFDARDRARLAHLLAPALLDRWNQRLEDEDRRHWAQRVKVVGPVDVELVEAVPAQGSAGPRVSVRVQTRLTGSRDPVVIAPQVLRAARRRLAAESRR